MKPILIGFNANEEPVYLTPEQRANSHMHVIGSTSKGKSKFLEWMMRKDIRRGHGFCFIDWHGKTYNDVLRYCARLRVGLDNDFRKVILLDPSQPSFITGFNPFMDVSEDITVEVNNRVEATIKAWGMENTNETPTLRRVLALLYYMAASENEPLASASKLLRLNRAELREYLLSRITDSYFREELEWLQSINPRDWDHKVMSSQNKLGKFLGSKGIRRYMGMKENNLDLRDVIDNGHILLVNLGSSRSLDRESAKVFASLLLHQFFTEAMERANEASRSGKDPNQYILYLDEFQDYITDDMAEMLAQVRKGGIHLVLSHQFLSQLMEKKTLLESVMTNARIRAVFGGASFEAGVYLANEMFLPDLNERQLKKALYHTIHIYEKQILDVTSVTTGSSSTTGRTSGDGGSSGVGDLESWFSTPNNLMSSMGRGSSSFSGDSWSSSHSESETLSETKSVTKLPVFVPVPVQELASETDWTLEEKRSKVAQILKNQLKQHCFIKLDTELTQPMLVPFVKEYSISPEFLLEYEEEAYREQGAIPAAQVDNIIAGYETQFLLRARKQLALSAAQDGPIIDISAEHPEAEPESDAASRKRKHRARVQKPKPKSSTVYDNVDLDQDKTDD